MTLIYKCDKLHTELQPSIVEDKRNHPKIAD
jgi:hypothetical protein